MADNERITVEGMTETGTDALETLTTVLGDSPEAWRGAYVGASMTAALIEMCNQNRIPAWMGTGFVHAVLSDFLEVALGYIDTEAVQENFDQMAEIKAQREAAAETTR